MRSDAWRRIAWVAAMAAAASACSFDGTPPTASPDGRPRADADPEDPDARPEDPDAAPTADSHLVLSEVRTFGGSEFVEIYNPTTATVQLRDYYLGDMPEYWQLPGVVDGNLPVPETLPDFVVRFPSSTLGPGQIATICVNPGEFFNAFGFDATFSVRDPPASSETQAMIETPFGVDTGVSITNAGELVVLFHWDGESDLVDDVDLFIAGADPLAENALAAKGPVDGPDAGTEPTAYAADALTLEDMEADTGGDDLVNRLSYKRILLEGDHEAFGGNGLGGHDETSEQTRTTWDTRADPNAYTPATPGAVDLI